MIGSKRANSLNIANPIKGFFRGFQSGFNRCVCKSCGITVLDGAVFCERCQQANDDQHLASKSITPEEQVFGPLADLIKGLLWVALVIGLLLGGLWVLVALVKFMWQHS